MGTLDLILFLRSVVVKLSWNSIGYLVLFLFFIYHILYLSFFTLTVISVYCTSLGLLMCILNNLNYSLKSFQRLCFRFFFIKIHISGGEWWNRYLLCKVRGVIYGLCTYHNLGYTPYKRRYGCMDTIWIGKVNFLHEIPKPYRLNGRNDENVKPW